MPGSDAEGLKKKKDMSNVFVYCEVTEERGIADVSLELLSKGRKLADTLGCQLEAIVIGSQVKELSFHHLAPYLDRGRSGQGIQA